MKHLFRWALVVTILLFVRDRLVDDPVLATLFHLAATLAAGGGLMGVFLYSRLSPSDMVDQATRARIRDVIGSEPGLGLGEIAARLQIGWGTAVYHLNRLEAAGLVASTSAGRRRAFFLPEHNGVIRGASTVLGNGVQRRLLDFVRARPGASQLEIARAAQVSAPLAHRYLDRLVQEGLLSTTKTWRTRSYVATPLATAYSDEVRSRQKSDSVDLDARANGTVSLGGTSVQSYTDRRQAEFNGAPRP